MTVFHSYDWLRIKDLKRCPYPPFSWESTCWNNEQNRQDFLLALDRYATYLQGGGEAGWM